MVKPKYGISHYGLGLKLEPITNSYTTAGLALDSTINPNVQLHLYVIRQLVESPAVSHSFLD
jgi:hypothetical protein